MKTSKDYLYTDKLNYNLKTIIFNISHAEFSTEFPNFLQVIAKNETYNYTVKTGFWFNDQFLSKIQNSPFLPHLKELVTFCSLSTLIDHTSNFFTSENLNIILKCDKLASIESTQKMFDTFVGLAKSSSIWLPQNINFGLIVENRNILPAFTSDIDTDTFIIGGNGGKDSTVSKLLMEKIGLKSHNIDILKAHWGLHNCDTSSNGLIFESKFDTPNDEIIWNKKRLLVEEYYSNTRHKVHVDDQSALYLMYFMPMVIYYLEYGIFPQYQALGTEWSCSNEWVINGVHTYDLAYDEGIFIVRLFDTLKRELNWNVKTKIVSPIAGLNEAAICYILLQEGWTWRNFRSCWYIECMYKHDSYTECEACMKCFRIKTILKYLEKYHPTRHSFKTNWLPEVGPSMFTYSVGANKLYETLIDKEDVPILNVYDSPIIRQFMGEELADRLFEVIDLYKLSKIDEPLIDFDLKYITLEYMTKQIIEELDYTMKDNPWKEVSKYKLENVPKVIFSMPLEDVICEYYQCHPIHCYYKDWILYNDNGKILVNIQSDAEQFVFKCSVPEFTHPILKDSLHMREDKLIAFDHYQKVDNTFSTTINYPKSGETT